MLALKPSPSQRRISVHLISPGWRSASKKRGRFETGSQTVASGERTVRHLIGGVNTTPLPAINPRECAASTNFLEGYFGGVRDCTSTGRAFNRPISAHSQGVPSLRASVAILVRRLESRSRQLRVAPMGSDRRNISSTC